MAPVVSTSSTSATEAPSRGVLTLHYVFLALGAIALAGSLIGYLKGESVAAFNWGFVAGKTQTIYPWDSWQKPYDGEPPLWFHDILRADGTPYRPEETAYLRKTTGK